MSNTVCTLPIKLNPCSRADHQQNAQALETLRDCLCALAAINTNEFYSEVVGDQPVIYDQPVNPPTPVQDAATLTEKFDDSFTFWTFIYATQLWQKELTIPIGGGTALPANTTACVTDLDLFPGLTFTDRLNEAITYLDPGGKLDLTNQGDNIITSTIVFPKAIKVIWPASEIMYTGVAGTDMFSIETDQFTCNGTGRSPKRAVIADVTRFIMTSGRYHFHSRGRGLISLDGFDCKGVKSSDSLAHPNLNGSGGLYFEKADPGTVSGGNNVTGLFVNNVYIEDTYAHGIYVDTPILSAIRNVRVSGARGHGFYQNGGTSTLYESDFCASSSQAGFCIQSTAYCSLVNCAGETSGVGFWLRSVQGISIFSTGGESNKNTGAVANPVLLTTLAGDNTTVVTIRDISSDFLGDFRGSTWLITGGQGIGLFSPYSTNITQSYDGNGPAHQARHFKVRGNTRGLTISNPRIAISSDETVVNRFDWEFDNLGGQTPSDVTVYYDPADGTITPVIVSYFTNVNNVANTTYIKSDTDDVVFYAGKQIYMSNDFDAAISLELGSGTGALAPKKVLLAP